MADHRYISLKAKSHREPGTERFHIIVGAASFRGHRLRGADCPCEPKIEKVKEHPNARVFAHHSRKYKCL